MRYAFLREAIRALELPDGIELWAEVTSDDRIMIRGRVQYHMCEIVPSDQESVMSGVERVAVDMKKALEKLESK